MNGEQEPFNESKLDRSLERVGASKEIREKIISHTVSELRDGMSTQEIYEHAFELLRQEEIQPVAARYSVKRAVLDLGPSGFPFERFIGNVLQSIGYTNVETGVAAQGLCAPHEVDVMALHDGKRVAAEVKFHNSLGIKTDLKVALYVKSRFDDLSRKGSSVDEGWLITNTRFTRNAARFGNCSGMNLLGWDYPKGRGLEVLIDEAGVHPVTALTTLSDSEKKEMLDANVVLCRQVPTDSGELSSYGIPREKHDAVRSEVQQLCSLSKNSNMTE
tara:strand:- start:21689 stop:22510 length:822 start_codon:yes stop_codon:yes gene_type:complete